jgi:serine/threonine protein phosphatase 1
MPPRTIAIGDIHGSLRAFDALLNAIAPEPDDTIVTLGDYVNRGPDSRGVLDRLIRLDRQCRLFPILGNHDEMLLNAIKDTRPGLTRARIAWLRMGGTATLASYGAAVDSFDVTDIKLIPPAHTAFLERCLPYYETETHIFLHANYDPNLELDEQPIDLLRWESIRDRMPGPHVSGKTVIAGHSAQKSGTVLVEKGLVCIDTHCYGGGWLTAFEVNQRLVWQTNIAGEVRPNSPYRVSL